MSELNVSISSSGLIGLEKENTLDSANSSNKVPANNRESALTKESALSAHEIREALEGINNSLVNMQRNLSFSVDERSGESIIIVKDSESDEMIRQIPSEELLVLRKKMDHVVGLLFDTKV